MSLSLQVALTAAIIFFALNVVGRAGVIGESGRVAIVAGWLGIVSFATMIFGLFWWVWA